MSSACDRFQDLLLDLVYDELEPDLAEELREHAAGCTACAEELDGLMLTRRLAAEVAPLIPPAENDEVILAAAADAAERHARERASQTEMEERSLVGAEPAIERGPGLLERLRAVLLAPALATAAVAVVVVVVVVFIGRQAGPSFDRDTAGGAAPFVGPAYPVGQEEAEVVADLNVAPEPAAAPAVSAKDEPAPEQRAADGLVASGRGGLGTSSSTAQGLGTAAPPADAPGKAKLDGAPDALRREAARSKSSASSPTEAEAALEEPAPAPPPAASFAQPVDNALGGAAKAPDSSVAISETAYREGMEAYRRGDCGTATSSLNTVVNSPATPAHRLPSAFHHLARCEKRRGRCGQALPWYEELISRFPSYPARPEALWESAACHRRLGHLDRSWALLDELARVPGWAERAGQERDRLSKSTDAEAETADVPAAAEQQQAQ